MNPFVKKRMKALNETIVPKVFLVLFGFQERLNKPLHPLLSESELAGAAPRPLPFFPRCRRPPPPTFLHRHHTHSCTTAAQPNPRLLLLLAKSQYSYIKLTTATPHLGRSRNPPSELAPMAAASSLRAAPFAAAAPVGSAGLGSA